jgi:L-amino acid N-acyltransferase YncA
LPNIRSAEIRDLEAIREIYNDAVLNTTATFDTEPRTREKQVEWFNVHPAAFPVIVFELDSEIAGWASLSKWSDRIAYAGTAECSVYVKREHRKKGIGRALLKHLIDRAVENKLHTIIARIAEGNETSIRMHKQNGFEIIGNMKEAGWKFGRYIDVTLMQKML